jgi:hypothetical protein
VDPAIVSEELFVAVVPHIAKTQKRQHSAAVPKAGSVAAAGKIWLKRRLLTETNGLPPSEKNRREKGR